jgi:signal transduction histidine kinase
MLPIHEYRNEGSAQIHGSGETLALAFASFTEAAGALERSYSYLQLEVKRLRQELKDANDTLEQEREAARRSQALAEVATLLAHEIRNPLASLELFAGLLADSSELCSLY